MSRQKMHIVAVCNGVRKGYIKSVSYSRGKFTLTENILDAKGYTSQDVLQGELDFLTSIGYMFGYVFIYE